jgi:hypothetical protein
MHLTKIFATLCVVSSAVAAPVAAPRNKEVIEEALRRISTRMKNLRDGMKPMIPWNRRTGADPAKQTIQILALDWEIGEELRLSTDVVKNARGADVNVFESTALISQINAVAAIAQQIVDNYNDLKPMIKAAKKENDVYQQLKKDSINTKAYSEAMNSKMPYIAQPIGSALKNSLVNIVETAVADFEPSRWSFWK